MNREIKFRVWNTKYQQWMNHCAVIDCDGNIGSHCLEIRDNGEKLEHIVGLPKEENVVQQFTGFKDSKGNDIYEGDILKCINRTANQYVEVKFENGCFLAEKRTFKEFTEYNDVEVAWNVMENPELLENEK